MEKQEFTKYERARILGARGLQIAMNAPLLIKIKEDDLEKINFDALKIAEIELDSGILPISVKRPLPTKNKKELEENIEEIKVTEKEKVELEKQEEREEINDKEDITELVNPEEENEED